MITTTLSYSDDLAAVCEICGAKPACWRIRYRSTDTKPVRSCYACAFAALKAGEFIEQLLSERALQCFTRKRSDPMAWHRFSVKFGFVDYTQDTMGVCILRRII